MKSMLTLCFSISLLLLSARDKTDKVSFYYVLENPKYYGLDSARSWFEIDGINDLAIQNKINDTLRKVFYETTNFRVDVPELRGVGQGPTPPFHTDYTFDNGNTYGIGWVRFKDSDSLLRLKTADGYHGSGMHLNGFSTMIANGKIAWIQIEPIGVSRAEQGIIQLGFSLVSGKVLPQSYRVAIDPAKRDSLEDIFDKIASTAKDYDTTNIHDCVVKNARPMPDSVTIGITVLIAWFRGDMHPNQHLLERKYMRTCQNKGNQLMDRDFTAFLNFKESLPFLNQDDWLRLQSLPNN